MFLKNVFIAGGIGTLIFFGGCQQSSVNSINPIDDSSNDSESFVLGEKLKNPYSVSSMKLARDSLVERGVLAKSAITDQDLSATHYYICFKPETELKLFELKKDSSLVLWDYPLDYEILEGGTVYRDPGIPEGKPNYQYTAVGVNQQLPFVEYEVLEELILEPEPKDSIIAKKTVYGYYSLLEQEALRITDNLPENVPGLSKTMGKWRPTGNIQVYDDILGQNVPVVSVNVRTRNWFKWWNGYTDINGNFRCSKKYYGDLSYSLKWQYPKNRLDIRSGRIGQAFFNGPSQKRGAWNLVISSKMSWTYAHIFRAGAFYVGQQTFGLKSKPFDLISIQAMDENGPTNKSGHYRSWNENIRIWKNWYDGTRISSRDLFSITAHELGHAHHDEIYNGAFGTVDSKIKEAWACAVSYYMTSSVYSLPLTSWLFGWYHMQTWKRGGNAYSPLMIDLVDSYNQRNLSSNYLQDRVSGYTLKQIETIIAKSKCKNITDFKNEIKALPLPTGITSTIRDEYLSQY